MKSLEKPPAIALTFFAGGLFRIPVFTAHSAGAELLNVISASPFSIRIGDPYPPGEVVDISIADPLGSPLIKTLAKAEAYTYPLVPTLCVANVSLTGLSAANANVVNTIIRTVIMAILLIDCVIQSSLKSIYVMLIYQQLHSAEVITYIEALCFY